MIDEKMLKCLAELTKQVEILTERVEQLEKMVSWHNKWIGRD